MQKGGNILGIDYGEKKLGIAISDENHALAFPKEIIQNDRELFSRIENIIREETITEIVIGDSIDLDGTPNALAVKIDSFIREIQGRFRIPVHKEKEFFTSLEARRYHTGKNKFGARKNSLNATMSHSRIKKDALAKIDASAAALILQRYLDRMNLTRK